MSLWKTKSHVPVDGLPRLCRACYGYVSSWHDSARRSLPRASPMQFLTCASWSVKSNAPETAAWGSARTRVYCEPAALIAPRDGRGRVYGPRALKSNGVVGVWTPNGQIIRGIRFGQQNFNTRNVSRLIYKYSLTHTTVES